MEKTERLNSLVKRRDIKVLAAPPERKTKFARTVIPDSKKGNAARKAVLKTGMDSRKTRKENGFRPGFGSSTATGGATHDKEHISEQASETVGTMAVRKTKNKKTKAPLMTKALQSAKRLFRS